MRSASATRTKELIMRSGSVTVHERVQSQFGPVAEQCTDQRRPRGPGSARGGGVRSLPHKTCQVRHRISKAEMDESMICLSRRQGGRGSGDHGSSLALCACCLSSARAGSDTWRRSVRPYSGQVPTSFHRSEPPLTRRLRCCDKSAASEESEESEETLASPSVDQGCEAWGGKGGKEGRRKASASWLADTLGPLWDTLLSEPNITRPGRMHPDGRTAQRFRHPPELLVRRGPHGPASTPCRSSRRRASARSRGCRSASASCSSRCCATATASASAKPTSARLANWQPNAERTAEIPFVVARIVLQDFTGVPLLVDLAAMRSAVARHGQGPGHHRAARAGRPGGRPLGPGRLRRSRATRSS